ncbi:hypothetical protein [Nitrosomonas sp. Nm132]|uniref:hypothetical protein n=1 Tax=Nitrosomonas sp. Nm132 TaxID=1881053 RepID=UPI000B89DE9B|nr:hypothetical protein [Nitrosomonas sp. Nm132]
MTDTGVHQRNSIREPPSPNIAQALQAGGDLSDIHFFICMNRIATHNLLLSKELFLYFLVEVAAEMRLSLVTGHKSSTT